MAAVATREKPLAPPLAPLVPARPSAQPQVTIPPGQPGNTSSSSSGSNGNSSTAKRALLVILHGKRVEDELLRNALQELKQAGHQVTVRVTFDRGDVERFVAEAVRLNDAGAAKYETIVAGGGDGTLNEVVGALMQHREAIARQGLSVALLPLGTANDFAATAGISVDPKEALRLALDASCIRPIDVATLNDRPFLNVAVAGGLAEVPPDELSSRWKRLLGPVAIGFYVLKRLSSRKVLQPHAGATLRFRPGPHTMRQQQSAVNAADQPQAQQQQQQQELEFQTDLLLLVAGNSRQMGRTVAVCPDALLDDGLLDFTLLSGTSLATQAAALLSALASRDDNDSAADSGICQLRASRLELLAAGSSSGGSRGSSDEDKIPVNRDGEPEPASHRLLFEVLHKVLPMHLPDERLLVSGQSAAASRQTSHSFITGSIKHPTRDEFVPAASAVPAAASASSSKQGSSKSGRSSSSGRSDGGSRRHRKHGLTVKTLRRMLVVAGPEGVGVRRRAALAAFGRSMALSLGFVLVGGVLGWVSGSRAAQARQQQQELRMQQRAQLARLEQQQAAAAKSGRGAASSRARRHQRRAFGRRQSEGVAVAAVV